MALRFHLLQFIRRLASRIAGLAERWASRLEPSRALPTQAQHEVVSRAAVGSSEPSTDAGKPYELIPLLNDAGEIQAGAFAYGLEESGQMIEFLRTESLYGSGTLGSQSVSGIVGDFAAKLTPSLASAVKAGQLMRIVGPPSVVEGLAKGTMTLVQSGGNKLGSVVTQGSSKIVGQARFSPAAGVLAPLVVYQAVHAIAGTQQLNEINRRLANIERTLSRIVQRQNAKDIGEVIAAASTLQDILAEHAHSGHFNAQMQDRISHCERDLRAHLERLKILKADFHGKISKARERAKKRERTLELAALIKEEGEQFGQDTRLLVALCAAVIQLEQGLMLIALEHHPESLAYRQKQMAAQIDQCRETLSDMLDLSEIKGEIKLCLDDMNWWQRNLFDRGAADLLQQASELPLDAAPVQSLPEPQCGGMLIWKDPEKGIQVRALPPEAQSSALEVDVLSAERSRNSTQPSSPRVTPAQTAHAPSTSLQVGSTYYLLVPDLGCEVPIRVMAMTAKGRWLGRRTDTPEEIYVDILVNRR
ncbi:MAG: hypothetical protein VKM34_05860 [Cyanobacteriota bacterium]|nr:hypothetical protein [Cyanobacteriota bacterium]